jgi:DNA invertase Pin-like site-specific DNA recombinase
VERQREAIEAWCAASGNELVALAIDDGVSGDVAPWKRPGFSPYVPATLGQRDPDPYEARAAEAASRAGEWDALVVYRLDRLARRTEDLLRLVSWCQEKKRPVYDTSGMDYTGAGGAITVAVLGGIAQGEREAMVARARSSFEKLAKVGRHRGGHIPWGYEVEVREDGNKYLTHNRAQVELIRSIAHRVIEGESLSAICGDLSARGVPTAQGKGAWRVGALSKAIRSDRLLGLMVREVRETGKPTRDVLVRGDDGTPVQRAEPILSRAELEQVRASLAENVSGGRRVGVRQDRSLLLRVIFCQECLDDRGMFEPMYVAVGRGDQRYYRCGTRSQYGKAMCAGRGIPQEATDAWVSEWVLRTFGQTPLQNRTWVEGNETEAEIARLTDALQGLLDDRAAGLFASERGLQEYRAMYSALEAQRSAQEALPVTPSGWHLEPSGETLADRWEKLDQAGRNDLLRSVQIRAFVRTRSEDGGTTLDDRIGMSFPTPDELLSDRPTDADAVHALGLASMRATEARLAQG